MEETTLFGASLQMHIHPGDVILVFGDYGVGKTAFIRGIVQGYLGESVGEKVASPSFSLLHVYDNGNRRICHYDFYRLGKELVTHSNNLFQEVEEEDVVCVEWADDIPVPCFRRVIKVVISMIAYESREIDIKFIINEQ